MTPKEFEIKMLEICNNNDDREVTHVKADELLCEVLSQLGYEKGVIIFKNTPKWYA